jgi:hypothetical protein
VDGNDKSILPMLRAKVYLSGAMLLLRKRNYCKRRLKLLALAIRLGLEH